MNRRPALFGLLGISLFGPAAACNGASSFCELPLTKFTFAGSHNGGAFKLDIPQMIDEDVPLVDVNEALKCYYENHDMDFVQQLSFGMRNFMVDVCTHEEKPGLFNCHGAPPAYGGDFGEDLVRMKDWLGLNKRELITVAPDNLHLGANAGRQWLDLIASKFGSPCVELNERTDVSTWSPRGEVSCALVTGRPNDNVTLGALVNNELTMVFWPEEWRSLFFSTYSEKNAGATSKILLKDFQQYATGSQIAPPNSLFLLQVIGSAKMPNTDQLLACGDAFCKTFAAKQLVDEMELSCVKTMSEGFNRDLAQDDTNPHQFHTDEACPEFACGCLGYRSPLEVVNQLLLEQGHSIQSVNVDYPEVGEKSQVAELTRRMNEANLRHFRGEPELGADWWSCHWQPVVGVAAPLLLIFLCVTYAVLAMLYPKKYGVCIRKQWQAYQERRKRRAAGAERGREEAFAYLQAERGMAAMGPGAMANPNVGMQQNMMDPSLFNMQGNMMDPNFNMQGNMAQQILPIVVAPSAGYNHQFQKFVETE